MKMNEPVRRSVRDEAGASRARRSSVARIAVAAVLQAAAAVCAAGSGALPEWAEPLTGMKFVALPKGCIKMGTSGKIEPPFDASWERAGYKGNLAADEGPRHEICIDRVWMATTEVTQAHWHKVMDDTVLPASGDRAKVNVTWYQAKEFAARLTALSGGKFRFRIPTEAEWEYACRAAAKEEEAPPDRDELADKAWYRNTPNRSYEVKEAGTFKANAFGLHDMLGNAWEWVEDSYAADGYARHALFNPKVDMAGAPRVMRGGSFRTELSHMRCAMRGRYAPEHTLDSIGMRLVREQ